MTPAAESVAIPQDRWLRIVPDVVQRTGLSRSTLYALMDQGKLKSVKVGGCRRVPESALQKFMSQFDGSGETVDV